MTSSFDFVAHGLILPEAPPPVPGGGPQTIAELFDRMVEQRPDEPALIGRHGTFTYKELNRAADRAANALSSLGILLGDRIAVCLPNDVYIVIAFLGAMRLGAIWVGVNRALAGPEKAYLLQDSGARVYVATPDMAEQISPHRKELPDLIRVVHANPDDADNEWARLQAVGPEDLGFRIREEIAPTSPAAIAYTSGTTGLPKGAVHSHRNLLLPGAVAAATGAYGPDVRQGVLLPLTILNLMVLGPLVAFQDGSCCVCMDRLDPEGIAEWVRDAQVGHFAAVPTIYHDLLTHANVKAEDLQSLRRPEVGGAECPEEFRRLYRERFGSEVTIGYGMTEAPTAVTRSDGQIVPQPGLCGKPVPQLDIVILDEENHEVPQGEIAEICVRPRKTGDWAGAYTPMLGYWNKPEATERALHGGVYHSGDLGLMEADGNLYIRGRRNELILRGGANVYPAEVERALNEHPAVAASAVFGLPDERLGERVVAVVQLAPDGEANAEQMRAYIEPLLAQYKVPEDYRFIETLPRNAMGKVVKRELEGLFVG